MMPSTENALPFVPAIFCTNSHEESVLHHFRKLKLNYAICQGEGIEMDAETRQGEDSS
jgi:hypothetical protein